MVWTVNSSAGEGGIIVLYFNESAYSAVVCAAEVARVGLDKVGGIVWIIGNPYVAFAQRKTIAIQETVIMIPILGADIKRKRCGSSVITD